jgi:hypothetical protein
MARIAAVHPYRLGLVLAGLALALGTWLAFAPSSALGSTSESHESWRWPVRGPVVRPFAVTVSDRFAAGQHRGIDVRARPGTTVRAACSGRVRFAGRVARLGLVVSVRCGPLLATYLELGAVATGRGRRVRAGARLGVVGPGGHLHLGARDVRAGRYIDPLTLLRNPGPSLPLGPAPAPSHPRRPVPRLPGAVPARERPLTPALPAPHGSAERAAHGVPPVVWAGLGLVATALPLGGIVAVRRSRQRGSWASTSASRRFMSSSR